MDLGIQITTVCNFSCNHCMFTCNKNGIKMSHDVIRKVGFILRDGEFSGVSIYGGEPFLDIDLFEKVRSEVYDPNLKFFVSSNGTFMLNKKRFEYVQKLCETYGKTNREGFSIRISNTSYHHEYYSEKMKRMMKQLEYVCKDPYSFAEEFYPNVDPENILYWNPFSSSHDGSMIYVDEYNPYSQDYNMNPSGRALKNRLYDNSKKISCILTADENDYVDTEFMMEDQIRSLSIYADGRIGFCCYCDCGTIGNIKDYMSADAILEDILLFRKQFRKKYPNTNTMSQKSRCQKCKAFKLAFKEVA